MAVKYKQPLADLQVNLNLGLLLITTDNMNDCIIRNFDTQLARIQKPSVNTKCLLAGSWLISQTEDILDVKFFRL